MENIRFVRTQSWITVQQLYFQYRNVFARTYMLNTYSRENLTLGIWNKEIC